VRLRSGEFKKSAPREKVSAERLQIRRHDEHLLAARVRVRACHFLRRIWLVLTPRRDVYGTEDIRRVRLRRHSLRV
jgi:hypothetical protein